jgi:surface antigen
MNKSGFSAAVVCLLLSLSSCAIDNNGMGSGQTWGTLGGAALGGLAGSQVGQGKGKIAAIVGGTLLGGLAGNVIGAKFDERDRVRRDQALSESLGAAKSKQVKSWKNPDTGNSGTIVPLRTGAKSATQQPCREYEETYTRSGETIRQVSRACLRPDGTWQNES